MRRARVTYQGAFHHAMNRGVNEEKIFSSAEMKYDRRKERSVRENQYFKRPSLCEVPAVTLNYRRNKKCWKLD